MSVQQEPATATLIAPVAVPKASEVFADILREKILRGEFAQGEPLPPERVLVEQSQLSRAAVRDSLAILKQQGLIITRTGRNGGSIVSRPTPSDLVESLGIFLQSQGWGATDPTLVQMREILEPWCAAFAAAHRTDVDLAQISAAQEQMKVVMDEVDAYVEASQAWHTAVARASHNVLMSAFMQARSDSILSAANRARYDSPEARKATIAAHRGIGEAIEGRDARRAYELMGAHVRGSASPLMESLVETARGATTSTS